jgi:hypothetical protein
MTKPGFRKTKATFIKESQTLWGDKFDYSEVDYVNHKTHVSIKCKKHKHTFTQSPDNHLEGKNGCKHCVQETIRSKTATKQEDFISKSISVHGDSFDYSSVEYVNTNTKVKILCKECGNYFEQIPKSHLKGHGCKLCSSRKASKGRQFINNNPGGKPKSIDLVLSEFREVHGDTYDYSKVKYKNKSTNITIICRKHGRFEQTPSTHRSGAGCPTCAIESRSKHFSKSKEDFIKEAVAVHGPSSYNYSLVDYVNNRTKIKIKCKIHGVFEQTPGKHLSGKGCPTCSTEKKVADSLLSKEEVLKKFSAVHPEGLFTYENFVYEGLDKPAIVTCTKHTDFEVTPWKHIKGQGCQKCASSIGERAIIKVLEENALSYESEKTFEDLVHKSKLRYDFYIESENLLIEYDGQQHFSPVKFGGMSQEKADKVFKETQERDKLKDLYAKSNGITLIRIPFWDYDKIESILNRFFE